jgi:hypothetical protein
MANLWWGGAVILTGFGALFCWGARTLTLDSLYKDASLFLFLALICAGLAATWPAAEAWLQGLAP